MNAASQIHFEKPNLTRSLLGVFVLVIACQVWLIFEKAINWDEFLHFGQIYEFADGRLNSSVQTIHTRFFGWATLVSQDIIKQIQAARFAMLAFALITAGCIVILARRIADFGTALFCGLVYLTAGFVFTNAFTYRPDPIAAAALMGALCIFAFGRLTWTRVAFVGLLIGLAGALTIKSVFYLPCFAAIAWLRWTEQDHEKLKIFGLFCGATLIAAMCFALLVGLHGIGLSASETETNNLGRSIDSFIQFAAFEKIRYVFAEVFLAPLVTIGLILLPFFAKRLPKRTKYLLLGLCGPLFCLLFYRNTFPYFFTFLLPPVCVAVAPALRKLIERYGIIPVLVLALSGPVILLLQEPFGTLERQRATIDEIERLFPEPIPYLSYSSYVPHYPRQFPSLISGVALRRYLDTGNSRIMRDIEAGQIAFVIATGDALDSVYNDRQVSMLPVTDVAALRDNFLKHSDTIYIAGKLVCKHPNEQILNIVREGLYSIDGGDLMINDLPVKAGKSIFLKAGSHQIRYEQGPCIKMWALDHVPKLPEGFPSGPIAGGF